MASRNYLVDVNRVVRAGGLDEEGVDAAAVRLARDLARRVDKVGADDAPLNLLRLFQSAMKDLQRAVDRIAAAKSTRDPGEKAAGDVVEESAPLSPPALKIIEESPLEKLRKKKAAGA